MAVQRNISTKGLTGKLGDVRRTNNFILSIEGVFDGNNLDLVVERAFLPKVSLQVLELRRGNDALKFAGPATWDGGQVTIIDTLSRAELDAVLDWFDKTYDAETGEIGLSDEYKKTGSVIEYASDGSHERTWPLEGLFISEFDLGQLDTSNPELKRISFTVSIDPSRKGFRPVYGTEYTN